jgi:hypothetical protein
MRKTIIALSSTVPPIIKCKQTMLSKLHRPEVDELRHILVKEGYSWAKSTNDMYYYTVECEGERGIGVSSCFGDVVVSNLRNIHADSFCLDDKNVKYTDLPYKTIMKNSKVTPKYRDCPGCKEHAPYDKRHDFRDADESDEQYHYKECRLCGHKQEYTPRESAKKKQLNKTFDSLL